MGFSVLDGIFGLQKPGLLDNINDGDTQAALITAGFLVSGLLGFPVALTALRLVTRRGGSLDELRAGEVRVPGSTLDGLERWVRRARRLGTPFALLFLLLFAFFAFNAQSLGRMLVTMIVVVILPLPFGALLLWWYSLKVGAALALVQVDAARRKARAEAKRVRASGAMDAPRWRSEVEDPVLTLCRDVFPVLNKGWGWSVGLIAASLAIGALTWFMFFKKAGAFSVFEMEITSDLVGVVVVALWAFVVALLGGLFAMPVILAMDPATASSRCARLEDDINALCQEDPGFTRGINFLKTIKALNKDQGLGFVVGGQVTTGRTLYLAATGIYGMVVAFGPAFMGEVGLAGSCGASGGSHPNCPFGWTYADDACFKLFGDDIINTPLPWLEAEEACVWMGAQTHLASITSEEQERAVQHVADGNSFVWIGLSDIAEEGSFVWSDDEPLEQYANFAAGQPDNAGSAEDAVFYSSGTHDWGDQAQTTPHPYVCARKATPSVASGGVMLGCQGGQWVMGEPYKHVESLSYLPPTIVYGIYKPKVYEEIRPTKIQLNLTVTTPAECAALVHKYYRTANAAEYSNVGKESCKAVFDV